MTGLRRTAIARKTELKRGAPLRRKQAMARVASAERTVTKQKRQRDTGPTTATKVALWARAGGRCELCRRDLTNGAPFSRHHRRPRGMGGSTVPWINDLSNLLLLCGSATTPGGCHAEVETDRVRARGAGWLVPLGYLPAEVPVLLHASLSLKPVFLTNTGEYAPGVD